MEYKIIRLTDEPKWKEQASQWFHEKWKVPLEAYLESMEECLQGKDPVPQWYMAVEEDRIIGGMGIIENDFHDRKDLTPNVCAVYTEEDKRCNGVAGALLNFVCKDMKEKGMDTLYLLTDHTSFYERYGWKFLCMVQGDGEEALSRMYVHKEQQEVFRKAVSSDLPSIGNIYSDIHRLEKEEKLGIGWIEGVYPTEDTAKAALEKGELFVYEENGQVYASAVINQSQVDVYETGNWNRKAKPEEVMVLHTLTVDPKKKGNGIGSRFVAFYETYAKENHCMELRMDTNERNKGARALYRKLGYTEVGIVPCEFNGIPDVKLVLLEKTLNETL